MHTEHNADTVCRVTIRPGSGLVDQARDYLAESYGRWSAIRARTGLSCGFLTRLYQGKQPHDYGARKIERLLLDRARQKKRGRNQR